MNRILFINSCVRKDSRTYKLAKCYIDTLTRENKNEVIERDITKLGLMQIGSLSQHLTGIVRFLLF